MSQGAAAVFLKGWKPGSLMPRSDARKPAVILV